MKNKNKDELFIAFCIFVLFLIIIGIWLVFVKPVFAQKCETELTDVARRNKFYTEQTIKSKIDYYEIFDCVENMSDEEYYNTFYKNDIKEFECVQNMH